MPPLNNLLHEKFAHLVAESGDTYSAAYAKVSDAKNPGNYGSQLAKRPEVMKRISEIKEEIATRSVSTISRKREVLRLMIEGVLPTKVVNKANGVEETFDKLAAMQLDCKLAGELADNLHITGGADLKLNFTVRDRESKAIDGDGVMDAIIIPDADDITEADVPALQDYDPSTDPGAQH